jgi:hypothetical protein
VGIHKVIVRVKAREPILKANIMTTANGQIRMSGSDPCEKEAEVSTNREGVLSFSFSIQTQAPQTSWTLTFLEEGASRPKYQHTAVTSAASIGSDQGNVRFD